MSKAVAGYLLFALIFLALFVYLWYFRCLQSLSSRMEEQHAEEWKSLGNPSLNKSMSLSGARSLLQFVWSRGYDSFEDRDLIALGNKTRFLLLTGIFIFVIFLIILVKKIGHP